MKQAFIVTAILLVAAVIVFLFWFHGASPDSGLIQSAEASDGFMGTLAAMLRPDAAERDLRKADPEYQGNEEKFWITANEMPTFLAQLEVAKAAVPSEIKLPYTSDKLSLAPEFAKDQWGRAFCVTGDKAALVILSTGGTNLTLKCRGTVDTTKLTHLPRNKTFKTESGYYAMVVDRK